MKMASSEHEATVWIDDKVEHLLQVTVEHKASKLHVKFDWELHQLKFTDILVFQVYLA